MTDNHGLTVRTLRHEKGKLKMVSRESEAPTPASAINDPPEELVGAVAQRITQEWKQPHVPSNEQLAFVAIAAVRQWDREQRAKIDARLAQRALINEVFGWTHDEDGGVTIFFRRPAGFENWGCDAPTVDRTAPEPSREPSNPDDYTDPFNMVTRSESGGLTEFKRR